MKYTPLIQSAAVLIISIGFLLNVFADRDQQRQIQCLEQDRVWVGGEFCADKP